MQSKATKPAPWKLPEKPPEVKPVPLPDGAVSWPSLVDSKEPVPKKKLREQQLAAAAAAAAAAASASASTTGAQTKGKQKKEKNKKGSGADSNKDIDNEGKSKSKSNRRNKQNNKDVAHEESQDGRKNRSQKGRGFSQQRGSSAYNMPVNMPYEMQPIMYPTTSPVFYPPAAYGVSPSVLGMPGLNVDSVQNAVRGQIDYYFSPANLVKDLYLRGKMDSNGWVELQTIAAFNRVRMLTPDLVIIASSVEASSVVEASPDGLFLRVKNGWEQWILPEDQRDANIKSPTTPTPENKGREASLQPKKTRGDEGGDSIEKSRDEDDVFQLDEEHESGSPTTMSDSDVSRLIVVKPSAKRGKETKLDKAGDDMKNVINDGLELYGKELRSISEQSDTQETKATSRPRPVGNGRKHGRARVNSNFYPASLSHSHGGKAKGTKITNKPKSVSVGWVLGSTPVESSVMSPSQRGRSGSYLGSSAPISRFQHPSYELLEENGFTQMKYEKFYDRCISERAEKGVGLSEEMNTLFRFWCYFLRDHFNRAMYEDFKNYALADSDEGYHYGIECLFRFYSYGLEKKFIEDLYLDFEELVLRDHKAGHLYGLEKFWAFHHYNGFPKSSKLIMNAELSKLLETDFKSLDDFKAKRERN